MKHLIILFASFISTSEMYGQVSFKNYEHLFTKPLQYTICRTSDSIKVDGQIDESSWKTAKWSEDFVDIEGDKKPVPTYQTRFKMLWDDKHLYVAAELSEPHIWAYLQENDTIVFHDNDFEIFIDPNGDTHEYFEIEVNALKTVFDLFMTKPYRNGGNAIINWNTEDLKVGVTIDGSLNNPADKDKRWFVEMSIPFSSVTVGNKNRKPIDKTIWRMNFSRVEWYTEIDKGVYRKKINPTTGKNLPENNWVWSPQGVINMHFPERWGYVQFLNEQPGKTASFVLPATEELKTYLWLIYYKQMSFYKSSRRYTNLVSDLDMPATLQLGNIDYKIQIEATTNMFEVNIVNTVDNRMWTINHSGQVRERLENTNSKS